MEQKQRDIPRIKTAVEIQNLTDKQIYNYLDTAEVGHIKALLKEDEHMMELARVPLNLSIMVLAYGDKLTKIEAPQRLLSNTQRRMDLFQAFVKSRVKREILRENPDPENPP